VFVIGRDEWAPEFLIGNDWHVKEFKQGFMVKGWPGGLVLLPKSDEYMVFVARGKTQKGRYADQVCHCKCKPPLAE
jgi:hypothetical protein